MSKLSDKPWENAGSSVGKEPACNAGDAGDEDSITGSGRSPGGEHGNPLQFLPGESHRQRSLVGYSPGCHRVRQDWSDQAHVPGKCQKPESGCLPLVKWS